MADVDYDETSHAELTAGPPKYRMVIPKSTRLALGLHNLDDDEKVLLDAEFSVKKVVSDGGEGSE